jgi:hypothetical protein
VKGCLQYTLKRRRTSCHVNETMQLDKFKPGDTAPETSYSLNITKTMDSDRYNFVN